MSQLETNTTDLQAILAQVNALPDAGSGGGGVETCTVTISTTESSCKGTVTTTTINDAGEITVVVTESASFPHETTCIKNGLICVRMTNGYANDGNPTCTNCELVSYTYGDGANCMFAFKITGDNATISIPSDY